MIVGAERGGRVHWVSRPVHRFGIDRNVELVWVSDTRISGGEDVELGGLEGY